MELRVRHRDGHYLWIWDHWKTLRGENDEVIRKMARE